MELQIIYTAQLKAALQVDSERIALAPGSRWGELLRELSQRHAEPFLRLALNSSGDLMPTILVCVNDCQVRPHHEMPLTDGDQITLLSAMSGG